MVNHRAILRALRDYLTNLEVTQVAEGVEMQGTETGFERDGGSFIDDGFLVGMEVTPREFPNPEPVVVTAVTDDVLTVRAPVPRTPVGFNPDNTLSVVLPVRRAWENVEFSPEDDQWYVDEQYLPGPLTLIAGNEDHGEFDAEPVYLVRVYGLAGTGAGAVFALADAVLARFRPGRHIPTSDGHTIRVKSDPAPYRGQLVREGAAHAVIEVTIPLWVRTSNNAP